MLICALTHKQHLSVQIMDSANLELIAPQVVHRHVGIRMVGNHCACLAVNDLCLVPCSCQCEVQIPENTKISKSVLSFLWKEDLQYWNFKSGILKHRVKMQVVGRHIGFGMVGNDCACLVANYLCLASQFYRLHSSLSWASAEES